MKFFTNEQDVFFFSDIHDSHAKDFILGPRGFTSPAEGSQIIIDRWNTKVSNKDIAFLLGDTVVGAQDKSLERFEHILSALQYSELYVMPGNHTAGYNKFFKKNLDAGFSIDTDYRLSCPLGNKIVHLIPNYFEIYVDHVPCILCHYPLVSWNHMSKGAFMIYGHCHNNLMGTPIGELLHQKRAIDVGVEACSAPMSFKEIQEILNTRQTSGFDHHQD